ncbi:uncharacterized protein LOC143571926 isoform X1 [Bidens hawaiensis]|uniref:uncharacterized protein LOC143571926 isoform X1 n=1 Tax=Bidens hawaiensis TaxID=980011 RepID=UPI00404941F2
MWKEFCKVKSTEESLAKSNKAKESAKANKNVARLGRTGYAGLREKANTLWQLLVAKYPNYLKNIRDERTKSYIMARAKKIKGTDSYELPSDAHETINEMACTEKKMIEDGTYFEGKDDPLIRVLGPEHGGRTRTISNVIGSTKVRGGLFKGSWKLIRSEAGLFANHERFSVPRVDASPSFPGSSYASGDLSIDYSSIEELKRCDLLFPYDVSLNMTVAKGKVWPSSETLLHTSQLNKDYVKSPGRLCV